MKIKFSECVKYMVKGPFGSDMKKSLYVPKGEDTYKVYVQGNAIQKDENLGDYYIQSEYFHQKLKRFEVHPGDYIITCDGTLGKYIKLSENIERGVISSSLLLLKLDEEVIYDKYFELLWDNSMLSYLASQARNACLVHLPSAKTIGEIIINLPELSVQREMADKAFLIVNIIQQRNKELSMLDDLIKARFVEMFGDMYLNSKGWSEAKLESMADVVSGITKGRKTKSEDLTEVPYMAVSNVKDGYIDWTTVKTIEATQQEIEQYRLLADDVLMTEGGDPDKVGRGAIIKEPLENCIHQNHIFRVRLDESMILPEFFAEYLQHQRSKRYFLGCAKQTTGIASINMTQLRALPVLIPPLSKQEEFVLFKSQVDKSKVEVQKALDETQKLFDSLMQQYFG
nr:restriction endonuclease subunit S [uncultured Blautia sp.]